MNKPITIVYEDFRQEMANLINNSGLPLFIVETVLQNYLNEVRSVARNQYQSDKVQYEQYEKSLLESRNVKEDNIVKKTKKETKNE